MANLERDLHREHVNKSNRIIETETLLSTLQALYQQTTGVMQNDRHADRIDTVDLKSVLAKTMSRIGNLDRDLKEACLFFDAGLQIAKDILNTLSRGHQTVHNVSSMHRRNLDSAEHYLNLFHSQTCDTDEKIQALDTRGSRLECNIPKFINIKDGLYGSVCVVAGDGYHGKSTSVYKKYLDKGMGARKTLDIVCKKLQRLNVSKFIVHLQGHFLVKDKDDEYVIQMEHCVRGSLEKVLYDKQEYPNFNWPRKIQMARDCVHGVLAAYTMLKDDINKCATLDRFVVTDEFYVKLMLDQNLLRNSKLCRRHEIVRKRSKDEILYISPEAKVRCSSVADRTQRDVFGLGVIMQAIASRERPYSTVQWGDDFNKLYGFITEGGIELPPLTTPHCFADIMIKCRLIRRNERPTLLELSQLLDELCVKFSS